MNKEYISAIQEFLRTWVLGIIPGLIGAIGVVIAGIDTEVGGVRINWILAGSILAVQTLSSLQTAIMSAVDKFIHKSGISTPLDFKSLDSLK